MNNWYTADPHFGSDSLSVLKRDNRLFRDYCLTDPAFKFQDVLRDTYVNIRGEKFFLTHKPTDHDKEYQTLFGHTHRYGGLWKPFGFNVCVDLNHFRLFGDDDIMFMLSEKKSTGMRIWLLTADS